MAEGKKYPKWQIFDQEVIDELETLYLEQADELKGTSIKANDALMLGILNFAMSLCLTLAQTKDFDKDSEVLEKMIDEMEMSENLKRALRGMLTKAKEK